MLTDQALSGEVGMSNQLEEISRSLYNGQLPGSWRRLAPDTLKSLGNWMLHFERRYKQVRRLSKLACCMCTFIVLYVEPC